MTRRVGVGHRGGPGGGCARVLRPRAGARSGRGSRRRWRTPSWGWLLLGLLFAAFAMTWIALRWRACILAVGGDPRRLRQGRAVVLRRRARQVPAGRRLADPRPGRARRERGHHPHPRVRERRALARRALRRRGAAAGDPAAPPGGRRPGPPRCSARSPGGRSSSSSRRCRSSCACSSPTCRRGSRSRRAPSWSPRRSTSAGRGGDSRPRPCSPGAPGFAAVPVPAGAGVREARVRRRPPASPPASRRP